MGASKNFLNFVLKKFVKEARWAQNFSIQWKISGNGYPNWKKQWAHDGRGAHEFSKNFMGVSTKKKTMGSAPFFKSHFFRAHNPRIPKNSKSIFKN